MPMNTATRSARRQATVSPEVRAEIERTAASVGEAMTHIMRTLPDALATTMSTASPAVPPTAVPDAAAEDRTAQGTGTQGIGKANESAGPNRATRREQDKQLREQEAAQRGLLADIIGRNRTQLLPHYITAGLLGLAEMIHTLSAQVQATGTAAVVAGLAVAGAGAAGVWLLRRRQLLLDGWKLWAGLLSAATAVWMIVAVLHGVTWGTFAAALAVEYSFGARWWRHHRHEQPTGLFNNELLEELGDAEPVTPDVEISHELIAMFPRRWTDKIGCPGGVLAGSALVSHKQFAHGIEYVLRLVGGKQDLATVLSMMSKIASGLEHPASRLIAEPFVDELGEENPALVRFTVVTSSPVKDDVFFREPIIRRGYIPIGPYADGRGMASYQLFKKKRMLNGLIIGGTGSGKSRLLELIGLVAMWTGYIHVIHADGMNGASCPMLWEHTEHYGRDDADLLLDRLEAMQAYREEELGRQKKSGFRPSREFPGVLVIMDEAHRMITDKNWPRWCNLAREINKLGMGILGADQDAKLSTWRDGTMRASLQAGNGIGLRIKDRAAGQILDSGGFNLFDLPKIPGTGYVMESDDAQARQAPYRGQWLPDYDDAFPEDEESGIRATDRQIPDDVVLIEDWYTQAAKRHAPLDHGTCKAKDSVRRRTNTTGTTTTGTNVQPTNSNDPAGPTRTPAAGMPTVPVPGATPTPTASPAAGMPTVPTPSTQVDMAATVDPAGTADDARLSDAEQRILAAVRDGVDKPGAIAERIGVTRQYVAAGLRSLADKGLVDKTGAGPAVSYEATGQVA